MNVCSQVLSKALCSLDLLIWLRCIGGTDQQADVLTLENSDLFLVGQRLIEPDSE